MTTSDFSHLSNTAQISLAFPYQMIIGMGPQVVPLILSELENEPDHWFRALEDGKMENGFEKIALSGSGLMYTHAARQLPDERWSDRHMRD